MGVLDSILANTKTQHRSDFQELIKTYWVDSQEGMVAKKREGIDTWFPESLRNKRDYGIELDFLKNFPVNAILNEKGDYEAATLFVKRVLVATLIAEPPEVRDLLRDLMKIKLNTMKILEDSNKVPKGKNTASCGPIDDTYTKLANRSEDIDISNFFEGFDYNDKAEIGIELIRNGLKYKKEHKGKWLTVMTTSNKKIKKKWQTRGSESVRREWTLCVVFSPFLESGNESCHYLGLSE
jgi:hypothetical protein